MLRMKSEAPTGPFMCEEVRVQKVHMIRGSKRLLDRGEGI